jgi:hypothetical protein
MNLKEGNLQGQMFVINTTRSKACIAYWPQQRLSTPEWAGTLSHMKDGINIHLSITTTNSVWFRCISYQFSNLSTTNISY